MYPQVVQFETRQRLALDDVKIRLLRRRSKSGRFGRYFGPWPVASHGLNPGRVLRADPCGESVA